jgi:hypothetical protein
MKTLVVVDKKTRLVICVAFSHGKKHDFKLFKESRTRAKQTTRINTDSGFQGIGKIHKNSVIPRKKSKNKPLGKEDKAYNRDISSERVGNENAIGFIKRFRIVSERYRNRRKRFGLRFSLLAGICNFELCNF